MEEARLAIAHGASAIGLVSAMPSGPGPIEEDAIRHIATHTPPPVATFLLTCLTDDALIVEQIRYCACSTIQLCQSTTVEARERIRKYSPATRIVQVVHVTGPESLKEAKQAALSSDALLLDSGRPHAATPELGGTGRTHNWTTARKIVQQAKIPVFLAGGLTAANARDAHQQVQPFAIDVCTGLRTNGKLDPRKLEAFNDAFRA
jgi:phosphoribosylanthranilate isomerase